MEYRVQLLLFKVEQWLHNQLVMVVKRWRTASLRWSCWTWQSSLPLLVNIGGRKALFQKKMKWDTSMGSFIMLIDWSNGSKIKENKPCIGRKNSLAP